MKDNELQQLYQNRFSGSEELDRKNNIWNILCNSFFSRFISASDDVLDIGSGYCEFLNNIKCGKKTGIDLNPETKNFAAPGVDILSIDCTDMKEIGSESYDIIFSSNFLEHLPDKNAVFKTLKESFRVLKQNGKIILFGPNIKYLYKEYWDFFDHEVPLTHICLEEILTTIGFKKVKIYPKFMPYTTKSRFPKADFLIKLYLKMPIAFKIFGKQFLIIMQK